MLEEMDDSLYHDDEVLAVLAELVRANPFPDCVTGKRGHEHRGIDHRTKRRLGALEWSKKKAAAAAAKREAAAAAAAAAAKKETAAVAAAAKAAARREKCGGGSI